MRTKAFFLAILLFSFCHINAQQFINKAKVEYEVRTNIKKTMGNSSWAELMKEKLPEFKTGYYTLSFADNKSLFKFDHWDNVNLPVSYTKSDEENVWYYDLNTRKFNMQKNVSGSDINVEDSMRKLKWKLTNENRIIAGFNCRKAEAVIFDSVYIFAFYTEEIIFSGGPCSINGLPGLILGLSIPRLYTSWIATKVVVNEVDENSIQPVRSKKIFDFKGFVSLINERTKDWYFSGEDQKMNFRWTSFL